MKGCSDCQQQLKLVYRVFPIISKSKAPDFKQSLEIQEKREGNLEVIIVAVERVSWPLVVLEAHGGGQQPIGQYCTHDYRSESW